MCGNLTTAQFWDVGAFFSTLPKCQTMENDIKFVMLSFLLMLASTYAAFTEIIANDFFFAQKSVQIITKSSPSWS